MAGRDDEEEPQIESPPEGSHCAEHPERGALAICPRCGAYACLSCWHHPVRRCHACLIRDPAAVAPPIAWEAPEKGLISRWVGTLLSALRPTASAPAFAMGDVAPAMWFALASFLPLALLTGVVPFTHTLLFRSFFRVDVIGSPTEVEIAIDVLRAIFLGLVLSSTRVLALALPYVSLTRAYGHKGHPHAPARVIGYRAWLVPLAFVLESVLVMTVPEDRLESVLTAVQLATVIPLVLLVGAMWSTARMGAGAGPVASVAAIMVPVALMAIAEPMALRVLAPLLPDPEATQQAAAALVQREGAADAGTADAGTAAGADAADAGVSAP